MLSIIKQCFERVFNCCFLIFMICIFYLSWKLKIQGRNKERPINPDFHQKKATKQKPKYSHPCSGLRCLTDDMCCWSQSQLQWIHPPIITTSNIFSGNNFRNLFKSWLFSVLRWDNNIRAVTLGTQDSHTCDHWSPETTQISRFLTRIQHTHGWYLRILNQNSNFVRWSEQSLLDVINLLFRNRHQHKKINFGLN